MSSALRRGDIYRVRQPQHGDPKKSRCFAVVGRQDLLDSKANRVLCAPINMSGVGLLTEVQVGVDEGLKHDSVINCDQITRLAKSMLTDYIGALSLAKLKQLRSAFGVSLCFSLDLASHIVETFSGLVRRHKRATRIALLPLD